MSLHIFSDYPNKSNRRSKDKFILLLNKYCSVAKRLVGPLCYRAPHTIGLHMNTSNYFDFLSPASAKQEST